MYERLKSPLKIGKLTLPNRLAMTAMGVNLGKPEGGVTDDLIKFYDARARGGVGLIIIIIHVTNCRANIKKCSFTLKKARRMAFTTQYRELQDKKVAKKAFNQKLIGWSLNSSEEATISSPAFSALSFHRLKPGSLNKPIRTFLMLEGLKKRPYPTSKTQSNIII